MQELPFANAEGHVFDEMVISPTLDNGFDLLDWLSDGNSTPDNFSDVFSDIDPDFNFNHTCKLVETPYISLKMD